MEAGSKLALFENIGVQGNWTLELPRSCNNIDYATISDVKLVLYFDADYSDELAAHVHSFYSNEGGRSLVLSARFHFPDEDFRLDTDRKITFRLHPARVPYNYAELKLDGLGLRLLSRNGQPLAQTSLAVARSSDGSTVQVTTDAQGTIAGDQATMAPFQGWKGLARRFIQHSTRSGRGHDGDCRHPALHGLWVHVSAGRRPACLRRAHGEYKRRRRNQPLASARRRRPAINR